MLHQKQNYDINTKAKQGDSVWIRNSRLGKRWLASTITKRKGNVMYKVTLEGKVIVWNRHANQLHIRSVTLPAPNTSDSSISNPTPVSESQNSQESVLFKNPQTQDTLEPFNLRGRRCSIWNWTHARTHIIVSHVHNN